MIQKTQVNTKRGRSLYFRLATAYVCSLLILGACASSPKPPTLALQAAEQAIDTAEQDRVTSPELTEARDKLTAARSAVQEEKMTVALRLAEQSRVGAELASAKAATSKAKAVNDEMKESTDAIEQEMQRNPGAQ